MRLIALYANATDLFFDEAQYWFWSTEPAFGYYSKPPLIAWLIAVSTGVCGVSEFCIRLPAPILHTATAGAMYLLARQLFDARIGLLAALAYATLPAVSFSSAIISTDVPLLLCWTLALWGFAGMLRDKDARWPVLVMGLSLGLGLNAKYAMAYFVLCLAIFLLVTPRQRQLLRDWRLWAALGLGVALLLPNLAWNMANGFSTLAHTADNAKWGGSLFHPIKALEFLAAQLGVMGPVLFWVLLVAASRAIRWRQAPDVVRLLLAFSVPIIAIVAAQAFISRAHANWAAPAYIAATVLVIHLLSRQPGLSGLKASFALHAAVLLVLVIGTTLAGRIALPGVGDPFARTLGWREVADIARIELQRARSAGRPYGAVISDDRSVSAELLYYMRDEPTPVLAWREKAKPQDHFELTRPWRDGSPEPALLVSLNRGTTPVAASFERVDQLGTHDVRAGSTVARRITLYALAGYRGK